MAGFYSATLSTSPAFQWPALSPPSRRTSAGTGGASPGGSTRRRASTSRTDRCRRRWRCAEAGRAGRPGRRRAAGRHPRRFFRPYPSAAARRGGGAVGAINLLRRRIRSAAVAVAPPPGPPMPPTGEPLSPSPRCPALELSSAIPRPARPRSRSRRLQAGPHRRGAFPPLPAAASRRKRLGRLQRPSAAPRAPLRSPQRPPVP